MADDGEARRGGEGATLGEALEAIRRATGADRASIAGMDPHDGTFSILHLLGGSPDLRPRLETTVGALVGTSPDVVVVTAEDGRAEDAVAALRDDGIEAPLVLVAGADSPELRRAALAAGAAGIVPRASVVGALPDALRVAADGGTWLPGPVGKPARDTAPARPACCGSALVRRDHCRLPRRRATMRR